MDQEQQDQKHHLEQQLQWTVEQVRILDEMNLILHEMKRIAEYALAHTLSAIEIERLNGELDTLKNEFTSLERQLYPILH
ncbi:hypothetical protein I2483_05950 [Sporosarcina sp. E16_3]|uniref:hypothetical protein n=1 Tax=Sporosarcina sp. E16_3 TaxID=2789293 RepID=UPI001A913183|nr:hypothetical protein [Sporosarcina sp. E16_3]MBO0601196.1 hypothetical protein [Sporosarcina sp. E16_3]